MKAEISGGEASDYKGFDLLRDGSLPPPKVFIADKGYDSNHIRETISNEGGTPVIPARSNRKEPALIDGITYALRNQVERCFNKLKCSRRLATRYDKTAASYLGFVHIVAARLWFRSLST
jgi:transposase